MRSWLAPSALALVAAVALGDEAPILQVRADPQVVNVGQPLTLEVTVLVPTWFSEPPVFPSFELTNTITTLPPERTYPISERIGGANWSGLRREYRIIPLTAATFELPQQFLKVRWAQPGAAPRSAQVPIPEVRYRAVIPTGAQGLTPYLAGHSFELSRTVASTSALKPGDALVLELEATLAGLPALFIPPLWQDPDLPGLRSYRAEPALVDGTPATRRERITLLFEQPGSYRIPGLTLRWWNLGTGKIEEATLPPLTLEAFTGETGVAQTDQAAPYWLIALVLLATLLWAGARRHQRAKHTPERLAYRALLSALDRRHDRDLYHATLHWLSCLSQPATASSQKTPATLAPSHATLTALGAVRERLYGTTETAVDYALLREQILALRRAQVRTRSDRSLHAPPALPPLNP